MLSHFSTLTHKLIQNNIKNPQEEGLFASIMANLKEIKTLQSRLESKVKE